MTLRPNVKIEVSEKGAAKTERALDKVNDELERTPRAAAKAQRATDGLGKSSAGLTSKLGNLGESLDKDLEQKYGRVFKATDRVNSIFGQLKGAAGLLGLAFGAVGVVAGVASAAFDSMSGAAELAAKKQANLARETKRVAKEASTAAAAVDALTQATSGLAGGRFDLTAAQELRVDDLLKQEAALSEKLLEIRKAQREQIAAQRAAPAGSVAFGNEGGRSASELESQLFQVSFERDEAMRDRELILRDAANRRRAFASAGGSGGSGGGGGGGRSDGDGLDLSHSAVPGITGRDPGAIARDEAALFKLPTLPEADGEASIFSSLTLGLDAVAEAAAASAGGIQGVIETVAQLDFDAKQKEAAQYAAGLNAINASTQTTAGAMGAAAASALLFGDGVKVAINAAAQTAFYKAAMTAGEMAFQIPVDLAFGGTRTPLLLAGLAAASAQMAFAGGISAATGGLNFGAASPASADAGAGGGAASAPESDPFTDSPEATETVINVNLVAQTESPRQDAHSAAIGIQDIFRVAGLTLGGG